MKDISGCNVQRGARQGRSAFVINFRACYGCDEHRNVISRQSGG